MFDHPFTRSMAGRTAGILLVLAAIGVLSGLLTLYTSLCFTTALADAALYVASLAVAGYYSWYLSPYIKVWQAQVGIALVTQFLCLAIAEAVTIASSLESAETFLSGVPLHLLLGIPVWIILLQWYRLLEGKEREAEQLEVGQRVAESLHQPVDSPPASAEVLDRISVKEGTRIHLISTDELLCIQANGDYATLTTAYGQYVKEQTMKYFETHLPADTFVRIHRSSIVNVNHILRVELFGKDTYQIRLTGGTTLRASATGYRLLKARLGL
ncbi:MAG: LytTR family transcriptional regulator DNA-binding domain-containing protein [Mediterranea sp.]|jgi:hypothetical protein|nr:LytTR family transcriptional regulator DNA-binding domain-containing protein [Mediterranea sp.]